MSSVKKGHSQQEYVRPAAKRVRLVEPTAKEPNTKQINVEAKNFDGIPAIQVALGMNGGRPSAGLIDTLTRLRNQFSLQHSELQTLISNSQSSSGGSRPPTSGSYYNALSSVLQTSDPRLLLLEKWCQSSPGLDELFLVWDSASSFPSTTSTSGWSKSGSKNQGQQGPATMAATITSLSLNIFSSFLTLLSSYYTFHPHAYPILKNIFENERWRRLCGYVAGAGGGGGSTSNDLILMTLRLLTVVVERWDGKKVLEGFVWEAKGLSKLLQMRRKSPASNPLIKPDIRAAYILFLLSFLLPLSHVSSGPSSSSNSQIKTGFLQQHSFHFTSIFKNLHQDHPAVVRRVFEVSWEGIWCDIRVSRSLKVGVFAGSGSTGVLQSVLKLYERNTPEGAEGEEHGIGQYMVADLAHHFLLAICTRPGVGLCFKDRGWYPRDTGGDSLFNDEDADDEEDARDATSKLSSTSSFNDRHKLRLHNPTLLTLLKSLKPTDDPRQNELAVKVLAAAPELAGVYLPNCGLTLDPPRLSLKWLANIGFLSGAVGSGSIPEGTWVLGGEGEAGKEIYRPIPPPLATIVNNVVPGGGANRMNMRNVFTKGLQFTVAAAKGAPQQGSSVVSGNLVQHTTALALIRCLEKLGRVRVSMEGVASALGEGSADFGACWRRDGGEEDEGEEDFVYERMKEGLWTKRLKDVVKEVRKRVPEFQVILAFCTAHLKTSVSNPALASASATVLESGGVLGLSEGEQVKKALLAECAMRLLWMYQEALPEVVEEARFDVGKVLVGFEVSEADEAKETEDDGEEDGDEDKDEDGEDEDKASELSTSTRLHRLTQLHILRFLRASPAFSFAAPSPSYPGHTHLYSLLVALVRLGSRTYSSNDASSRLGHRIYEELRGLMKHVLGKSIVFRWGRGSYVDGGEDGEGEAELWLSSLPRALRRVRAVNRLVDVTEDRDREDGNIPDGNEAGKMVTVYPETLDGTQLTDERLSAIKFLEDCVLRCTKTPYKYIEDMERLAAPEEKSLDAEGSTTNAGDLPSPLVATFLEQLEAKLISQGTSTASTTTPAILLSPSDVLAITTYIRTVVFSLVGELDPGASSFSSDRLLVLQRIVERLERIFAGNVWEKAFGGEPHGLVRKAVTREVKIARRSLGLSEGDQAEMDVEEDDEDVDDFLDLVEALEIASPAERRLTVYELIDWVRLLGVGLKQAQLIRLWDSAKEIWAEGLGEVIKNFDVPDLRACEDGVSVWEALLKEGSLGAHEDGDAMEVDNNANGDENDEDESDGDGKEEGGVSRFEPRLLPFEWLLVHALPRHLSDSNCQQLLLDSALTHIGFFPGSDFIPTTISSATLTQKGQYVVRHLLHRFSAFFSIGQPDAAGALLSVLASFLEKLQARDKAVFAAVKRLTVMGLKEFMLLPASGSTGTANEGAGLEVVRESLLRVQNVVLEPCDASDRTLVADIAGVWAGVLNAQVEKSGMENGDLEYAGWWIRFFRPADVFELLGGIVRNALQQRSEAESNIVKWSLAALGEALRFGEVYGELTIRPGDLNLLFKLHTLLSNDVNGRKGAEGVEELIAAMLQRDGVPVGMSGEFPLTTDTQTLGNVIEAAQERWNGLRAASVDGDVSYPVRSFLAKPVEEWTEATEQIVCYFLYKQKLSEGSEVGIEKDVVEWLKGIEEDEGGRVVGIVHALGNCVLHRGQAAILHAGEVTTKIFELLLRHVASSSERTVQAREGLQMVVEILFKAKDDGATLKPCFALIERRLKSLKKSITTSSSSLPRLTPDIINLSRWLVVYFAGQGCHEERVRSIGDDVVEVGIQWLIRKLGFEDSQEGLAEETSVVCRGLAKLMKEPGISCKSETLETLLGVIVQAQYHIAHHECLGVAEVGLATVSLKPLVVNRYLQGIVQHPHFFKLCTPPSSSSYNPLGNIRDSITSLLKTLFFLHPANTCQVSHIEPLIRVYGATLALSDAHILSIFKLFEGQRKLSLRHIIGKWAPPSSSLASATGSGDGVGLEALQSLDQILTLRTALSFPSRRGIDNHESGKASLITLRYECELYDPLFLLPLLQHVLVNSPPTSAISWIELFRSNVVGLALRALSAKEGRVREVGMGCVVGIWGLMQNADLQEREHVAYLLGLLKNAIPRPPPRPAYSSSVEVDDENQYPPRLPSYTTLLLFHALRGIFNPSTFVYPLTSRFLLQRPELDITDVPMLYNMLYSSDTNDWKKERGWIVRFLADGIFTGSGVGDWRLLKRRHVWDLLASLYQSAGAGSTVTGSNDSGIETGAALKLGILDFLANVTRHRGPTMSLVLKSGLLSWIEMQLTGPDRGGGYGLEWLRILENVVVVVDAKKLESGALKGTWLRIVFRCVQGILEKASQSPLLTSEFPLAVRLILRLSLIESIGSNSLGPILEQALVSLKIFESRIKLRPTPSKSPVPDFDSLVPPALHCSHGLHEKLMFDLDSHFFVWGRSIELLWRASMNLDSKSGSDHSLSQLREVWKGLVTRLLVWRGLVGVDATPVGEWVRVECVKSIGYEATIGD